MHAKDAPVVPGDLIDGRYLVEAQLGSGGMAVVHRVRHTGTGARAALKLVHPHLAPRPELVDLFLREARAAARVGPSPHVVAVLDAGVDPARGVPYLVMELLEGQTLDQLVAREGPVPPPLLCAIVEQLAEALDQAHRAGVVHRDLKPSNLFLTAGRRGQPCLKVMDFGIAKVLEGDARGTATQVGTPAYAAPEQMGPAMRAAAARQGVTLAAVVSPETDVWAVGLLAYELVTGLPAAQFWGAETPAEIPVKAALFAHEAASARAGDRAALLPPGFDAWFARATHPDAAERWPSAGVAAAELVQRFALAPAADAPPPPPIPSPGLALPPTYGPGATEISGSPGTGAPLPTSPITSESGSGSREPRLEPNAGLLTWAGGTPPPPRRDAPAAPPPAPRPTTGLGARALVVAGALVAGAVLAGGAALVASRLGGRSAPDACRESGDASRCQEACDAGDGESCARLAEHLERGAGMPRDDARAAALYGRACDAGEPSGCAGLGRLARLGRGGLPRDPARAARLFQRACDARVDRRTRRPSDDDWGHAARPPRRAARADGTRGCALLGEAYRDGAGVDRDEARAVRLFRDACDEGDLLGCKDLGGMQQYGLGGLSRDEAAAASLYRRACDGGEALGCNDSSGCSSAPGAAGSRRTRPGASRSTGARATPASGSAATTSRG